MKKTLTLFLTVLLTVVSVTSLFAQNSFSVKYIAQAGFNAPPPELITVEAKYTSYINTFTIPSPPTVTTCHPPESKYVINGITVPYLAAPTPIPNKEQTFDLDYLKVSWTAYQNGFPISRTYTFSDLQILSANSGNEIDVTIPKARIRLKAIHSGAHVVYQITLQTF